MIARRFRERHHWLERCGFPGDLQPAAAQPLVLTHAHQLVGRVKGILPGWQLRGSRLTGERRRSCQADRRGWAPSVNVSPLGCRHPRQEAVANAVTTIRRQWRPHLTPSLPLALVFWRRSARMTAGQRCAQQPAHDERSSLHRCWRRRHCAHRGSNCCAGRALSLQWSCLSRPSCGTPSRDVPGSPPCEQAALSGTVRTADSCELPRVSRSMPPDLPHFLAHRQMRLP